jgi:hypothetical protein
LLFIDVLLLHVPTNIAATDAGTTISVMLLLDNLLSRPLVLVFILLLLFRASGVAF